jgi:hypothetical protein
MKQQWMDIAETLDDKDLEYPQSDPDIEMYRDASTRVDKDIPRTGGI